MSGKKTVLLGMSGGVDSAYSAYLLQKQNFQVTGVYLKMHDFADESDAVSAANNLDIPIIVQDCRKDFEEYVVENFIDEYSKGRTPNPCVVCNRHVKIAKLMDIAKSREIEYIATGHYVRIKCTSSGRYYICRAADEKKDQSYFLWNVTNSQLSHLITPLSVHKKEFVKIDAMNKSVLDRRPDESQEICFIPDGDYKSYIESIKGKYPEGNFISADGKILGTHKGIIHYTIGQRKKLGLALGVPFVVTKINAADNTVTIEPAGDKNYNLFRDEFAVDSMNFGFVDRNAINDGDKFFTKVRYAAKLISCSIKFTGSNSAMVYLDEPAKAITAGQSCVFYTYDGDGDMSVAFGGIIDAG